MCKLLIPVSLLVTLAYSFAPVSAEDAQWLTEDQMQKMSVEELQAWASKTEKSVKTSKVFDTKPKSSHAHMERRLGYHPMLAENSPDVWLREEIPADSKLRPDGSKSSAFPEPKYYDDVPEKESKGVLDGVMKVVGSPVTGTGHMLHHTGKAIEKMMYFLDEKFPWI